MTQPFRLRDHVVHPDLSLIRGPAGEVHVEPKVMAVLQLLASKPEEVVSRAELLDQVWTGTVVTDEAVTRCISELRTALRDDRHAPIYIQTLPKRGYRLLVTPEPVTQRNWRAYLPLTAAAALLVGLGVSFGWRLGADGPPPTIAVLPFVTDTGAAESEYFGEGIAEGLLNTFAELPELDVSARSSCFAEELRALSPQGAGKNLGADYVLTGDVQRVGATLRVAAELVDVDAGATLWSATIERAATDVFEIQDSIAGAVVEKLGIGVAGSVSVARVASAVDAFDYYLLGRHHLRMRSIDGLRRSAGFFQRAVDADSLCARCYSGLADSYLLLHAYGDVSLAEAVAFAQPAIERALAEDPQLAEAHASQGMLHLDLNDLAKARRALTRAVELNPNYAMANMWLGNVVAQSGRLTEAQRLYKRAQALEPRHPVTNQNLLHSLLMTGDYAAAEVLLADLDELGLLTGKTIEAATRFALETGAYEWANELIDVGFEDDGAGAALARWKLHRRQGDWREAELALKVAAEAGKPDKHHWYAAMETFAITSDRKNLELTIEAWTDADLDPSVADAWRGVERIHAEAYAEAIPLLESALENGDYANEAPFRLDAIGFLLVAYGNAGNAERFQYWHRQGEDTALTARENGYGSRSYLLAEALFYAAAKNLKAARDVLLEVRAIGGLFAGELSRDPRFAGVAASLATADLFDKPKISYLEEPTCAACVIDH